MALIHTYEREFGEIGKTQFWKDYEGALTELKLRFLNKLQKDNIGTPTVKGEIWQENLKLLDDILKLPLRILTLAANKEGE